MKNIEDDTLVSSNEDRELVFKRVFNASPELIWEAWTNPNHVVHWWGPEGFTNTIHEMEVKPGGVWRFMMHGPDGIDYPNRIVFEEVVKPERLVYSHGGESENDPHKFRVTVTFNRKGNKTELTMRSLFPSEEARNLVVREFGAVEGANQTLEKLDNYLLSMKD